MVAVGSHKLGASDVALGILAAPLEVGRLAYDKGKGKKTDDEHEIA